VVDDCEVCGGSTWFGSSAGDTCDCAGNVISGCDGGCGSTAVDLGCGCDVVGPDCAGECGGTAALYSAPSNTGYGPWCYSQECIDENPDQSNNIGDCGCLGCSANDVCEDMCTDWCNGCYDLEGNDDSYWLNGGPPVYWSDCVLELRGPQQLH
jgi:hypothetical protein